MLMENIVGQMLTALGCKLFSIPTLQGKTKKIEWR